MNYYQADLIVNQNDERALAIAKDEVKKCTEARGPHEVEDRARAVASQIVNQGDLNTRVTLGMIKFILRKMGTLPGQRTLVLVSPGFLARDAGPETSDVINAAAQSNVTLNTLDARGLYVNGPQADQAARGFTSPQMLQANTGYGRDLASANADVMAELADGTGGAFFQNSNDLVEGFRKLALPPEYLYLLEFTPQDTKNNGTVHRLKVKVDQDGLRVQSRLSYFAPKADKQGAFAGQRKTADEQIQTLERVRRQAQASLLDVANYSCVETVERSERPAPGASAYRDLFYVQVSVIGGHERFTRPGDVREVPGGLASVAGTGLTSSGMFSMFANDLFSSSHASIFGAEQEQQILSYDFRVPRAFSGWMLVSGDEGSRVGERGRFAVDARSLKLLRMEVNAEDIPASAPYSSVRILIDYLAGTASGGPALLPSSAEVWVGHKSGDAVYERAYWSQCRKFSAEATVRFDQTEGGAADGMESARAVSVLPVGLRIPIQLQDGIHFDKAEIGSSVRAAVARDVVWNGRLFIRGGTPVEGHVRNVIADAKTGSREVVVVEFDKLVTQAGTSDFIASLRRSSRGPALKMLAGEAHLEKDGSVRQVDVPGVVSFLRLRGDDSVRAGSQMEWLVEDLSQRRALTDTDWEPTIPMGPTGQHSVVGLHNE